MVDGYQCCICKETVSDRRASLLDPCAVILVSNIDQQRENQKEQQFYCHFECFRRLMNNDGVMYIMDPDFSTTGEVEQDEEETSEN